MTGVAWEVQFHIGINELHCLCTAIYRMNQLCPTPHGINAEAASVTEHVEHPASFGIMLHKCTVVSLVHEEARLLTFQPVNVELQSILASNVIMTLSKEKTILLTKLSFEGKGCLALVVDSLQTLAHDLLQSLSQLHSADMHTNTMCLHDSCPAIDVYHQARQVVSLAMNQTENIIICSANHSNGLSHIKCCCKTFLPESLIDGLTFESQDTHCNAAYLPMSYGKEASIGRQHLNDVTFLQSATFCMMNGTREYPGMKAPKAFLLAFS